MAKPTCPHCKGKKFETTVENKVAHSDFKLTFVICSGCGAPIAVLDYYNTGEQLKKLHAKVDKLA